MYRSFTMVSTFLFVFLVLTCQSSGQKSREVATEKLEEGFHITYELPNQSIDKSYPTFYMDSELPLMEILNGIARQGGPIITWNQTHSGFEIESVNGIQNSTSRQWILVVNGEIFRGISDRFSVQQRDKIVVRYDNRN